MGKQPTDDLEAVRAGGRGSDPCRPGDGVVTRARKRPRGFYARLARARGVSLNAVYRKLNPDKRPSARARHECDASPPWDPRELIRMDRAFCDAMRREIARGSERPRGAAIEHDPEKWVPVFGKRSCSSKKIERDDDSKKSHPVLEPAAARALRPRRPPPRRSGASSIPQSRAETGERDRSC
jgi:hypothetical protein